MFYFTKAGNLTKEVMPQMANFILLHGVSLLTLSQVSLSVRIARSSHPNLQTFPFISIT